MTTPDGRSPARFVPAAESRNGSTPREGGASKWAGRATIPGPRGEFKKSVPTETPPPYFPQNPLSPGDEKTARRVRLTLYGCVLLVLLLALGVVAGAVYLLWSFK